MVSKLIRKCKVNFFESFKTLLILKTEFLILKDFVNTGIEL